MSSIFTKIINREIEAFFVDEDNDNLAFLDIAPLAKGHVLVIPKQETDYIFDLDTIQYLSLWKFTQKVATAMKKVLPCDRIGVSVIGFEVPHVHVHLVPINNISDLNFENKKLNLTSAEMKKNCTINKFSYLIFLGLLLIYASQPV